MKTAIIDRGRGPEIAGTRVTVYRIMDFMRDGSSLERIATELRLSGEQVQAALNYISAYRSDVEAEYERILSRPRANAGWVEAGRAKSIEELKQRILARDVKDAAHADCVRQ